MKTIFITGIAGLIGSSLAKYYLKKGYKVGGCDSLIGGYESNIPNGASFYKVDICDYKNLRDTMRSFHTDFRRAKPLPIDVVIHCAALAYEGLSVFSPSMITNNIYSGTINVATAAILLKAKMFINCSSMARYGEQKPPFTEDMECNPTDPYGLAKLHAEQQLNLLADIYPEFNVYTVVPHNVSGAHQVYTDPYRNVLSIMIHQALAGRPIFIYGDGEQKRSFSHVDDCVHAIDRIVQNQPVQKLFNIGPDNNEITITELANQILKLTKSNVPIKYIDPRPREVKNAWCSSARANKVLNYKATKKLDAIILDIIDYIRINGISGFNYNLEVEIYNNKPIPKTWGDERLFNQWTYDEKSTSY